MIAVQIFRHGEACAYGENHLFFLERKSSFNSMSMQEHEIKIAFIPNGMLEVPMLEAISFTGRAPVQCRRPVSGRSVHSDRLRQLRQRLRESYSYRQYSGS